MLGFAIVGLFVVDLVVALAVWKFGRIEEKWSAGTQPGGPGPEPPRMQAPTRTGWAERTERTGWTRTASSTAGRFGGWSGLRGFGSSDRPGQHGARLAYGTSAGSVADGS